MNWLPRLRHGGDSWWLPLSRQSCDVVAAMLLAADSSAATIAMLRQALRRDPALLIHAALSMPAGGPDGGELSTATLAILMAEHLPGVLADGSQPAAGPEAGDQSADDTDGETKGDGDGEAGRAEEAAHRRWRAEYDKLARRCARMPIDRWLELAPQWLEVTGPPVPASWRAFWPRLVAGPDEQLAGRGAGRSPVADLPSYIACHVDLSQLARRLRCSDDLLAAFDRRLAESKRQSLHQLAYGLSHEINNPLANISTQAQLLARDEGDERRRRSLQRIIDQAMRAHAMVADLMFYAHPPQPEIDSVDLPGLCRRAIQQLQERAAACGIEISLAPAEPLVVAADRHMMLEAVRVLLVNAIEAVGCDGQLRVDCVRRQRDGVPTAQVTVADSGPGLSPQAAAHAFDPYFSGREAGRGLGVGLCRAERIASLHHGGISLASPGPGCTATIWIPLPC